MCPEITNLDTSMNGDIKTTLSTGQFINNLILDKGEWKIIICGGGGNVVCHSISTNRPDPIWLHNSNYKGVI